MTENIVNSCEKRESGHVGTPDFSVVMVCLNNRGYLEQCLESTYGAVLQSRFEVVVVDNGSTDGSQEMIAARFPEVTLIRNSSNVGLSRASNQGITAARGRYLLLLNDDTLVNGPSLDSMVDFLDRNPQAAAVGGQLLNPDGSFQAGYTKFSTLCDEFFIATGLSAFRWDGYPSKGEANQPIVVDWLGSACLLLRREALEQVGLLDEEYFIYGDEADLQYRFRCAGWLVYYLPSAYTVHFGGRSMDRWRRRKMVYRGKMLFYRKNYSAWRAGALRLMLAMLSLAKLGVWAVGLALPACRKRARYELHSNLAVVGLCWRLV